MALLQVHNNNEHEIMLNTPNRNEILREGPPLNAKYNVLGRGAYGTVFKAIYRGQAVAVKIVRNVTKANVQALCNEAHILGWKHRNLIRTFKIESTPSFGIIIMERFMGRSLQMILETIELPLEHRLFITLDILSALSYCHKRQLLHLDVKPQNVLVSFTSAQSNTIITTRRSQQQQLRAERLISRSHGREYICKLCDFGASMKFGHEPHHKGDARGTVRYMSPEALREQKLTAAADIYSLGITMWQLQQRQLPYNWIECNDVVAYQVVKHNLRPDASNAGAILRQQCSRMAVCVDSNIDSGAVTHKCSCTQSATAGEEISCHALEHITQLLNDSKMPAEQLHFSAGCSEQQQLQQQSCKQHLSSQRRPFEDLSAKMNVLRDLRAEWDAKSPLKTTPKQKRIDNGYSEQQQMLTLFASVLRVQDEQKELSYEALYRLCWHSAPLQRPSTFELRQRIVQLL